MPIQNVFASVLPPTTQKNRTENSLLILKNLWANKIWTVSMPFHTDLVLIYELETDSWRIRRSVAKQGVATMLLNILFT